VTGFVICTVGLGLAGQVVRMCERRGVWFYCSGKLGGQRKLEDLRVNVKIILRWILKKYEAVLTTI